MKNKLDFKKYIVLFVILFVAVFFFIYRQQQSHIVNIIDEEIAMSGSIGVTPQMFGAKADGKKNDTKAVQAAIDYASKNSKNNIVFLPEGTYSVKDLKLKKNVKIIGEGEKSILLADRSCVTWSGILHCNNLDSVYIQNVTFDGNKPVVPGSGEAGTVNMWIVGCKNVYIADCTFQNNWYLAICIKASDGITIERNKFINVDCGVLTAEKPSSNILIDNNYFDGAEYSEPVSIYGMKKGYHENITITNNIIKNHTLGSGILLRAAKTVVVRNNVIDNCGTGIYCTSITYGDETYGVYDVIIEDNNISNTPFEGILLENLNDSQVLNNTLTDCGTYSISTRFVSKSEISNNVIRYSTLANTDPNMPYVGFSLTLKGIQDSKVTNNSIFIEDQKLDEYRSPIHVGKGSANYFANNNINTKVLSVYSEDKLNAIDNTFASN